MDDKARRLVFFENPPGLNCQQTVCFLAHPPHSANRTLQAIMTITEVLSIVNDYQFLNEIA
jgi:hypothetical protein